MLFSSVNFCSSFFPRQSRDAFINLAVLHAFGNRLADRRIAFFYAYWDAALLTLLGSIVFNFVCGKRLFAERSRALL